MAREIPEVVRAATGLAATVLDEARKLPATLPGLPVRLIGLALQSSLKLQQEYSGLVARGDEVLDVLRGSADDGLATFDDDDDLPARPTGSAGLRTSPFDLVEDPEEAAELDAEELADADLRDEELVAEELADELVDADLSVVSTDDPPAEVSAEALIEAIAEDDPELSPAEVAALPADPEADAITAAVDELAAEVAAEVAVEVPEALPEELLEEVTADAVTEVAEDEAAVGDAVAQELIADAVVGDTLPEDAPGIPAEEPVAAPAADDGGVLTTADGADEAVPEQPADDAGAAPVSPVEGYDVFSIPALRGRLRSYPAETVADLLDYERATQARAPYVTLLQNRLEKLSADRG